MIRKTFGVLALLVLAAAGALFAGVLYAQNQKSDGERTQGGMMGMMEMMRDCPMMSAMMQGPDMALKHRSELGLTDAQAQRLQALRDGAKQSHMQAMQRMQALHREIAEASKGERFNEAAVRAAFDRMGDLHTEMGVAMLRTRQEARQVLTPEQRNKLEQMGSGMMGMGGMMRMHGMMGGGMMEDCPMMKGGMMGEGTRTDGQGSGANRPMQHHPRS